MSELKACPCCASGAHFQKCETPDSENWGGKWVECRVCGLCTDIMFPLMDSVDEQLAEKWNRRPAPEPATVSDADVATIWSTCDTAARFLSKLRERGIELRRVG